MDYSIWDNTLDRFWEDVVSSEPTPASVTIAASSAAMAFALLIKILRIGSRRKDFIGDPEQLVALMESARKETKCVMDAADHDVTAFRRHLEARRLPNFTEAQRNERNRIIAATARDVVEVPLLVARPSDSLSDDASSGIGIGPADGTGAFGVGTDISH